MPTLSRRREEWAKEERPKKIRSAQASPSFPFVGSAPGADSAFWVGARGGAAVRSHTDTHTHKHTRRRTRSFFLTSLHRWGAHPSQSPGCPPRGKPTWHSALPVPVQRMVRKPTVRRLADPVPVYLECQCPGLRPRLSLRAAHPGPCTRTVLARTPTIHPGRICCKLALRRGRVELHFAWRQLKCGHHDVWGGGSHAGGGEGMPGTTSSSSVVAVPAELAADGDPGGVLAGSECSAVLFAYSWLR